MYLYPFIANAPVVVKSLFVTTIISLTWNEHVTHIVKKGSKWLYAICALKKCGLTDRQLILVYCSIIRSVLEYASPAWAGLTQYLSDQIESIQKRALKIIFPSLCYENALKKLGLVLLRQRRVACEAQTRGREATTGNASALRRLEEGGCVHNISQAKLLFFRLATKLSAASCTQKTVCP